jgi:hypothetical protein
MKVIATDSLAVIGLISILPQLTLGCNYLYFFYYDRCNGMPCSYDSDLPFAAVESQN